MTRNQFFESLRSALSYACNVTPEGALRIHVPSLNKELSPLYFVGILRAEQLSRYGVQVVGKEIGLSDADVDLIHKASESWPTEDSDDLMETRERLMYAMNIDSMRYNGRIQAQSGLG